MSFQGFIGGNLLVTGGVIARHVAANQIDGDKITFVEASGRNLRADTLEVQAANVIGTLKASQIDATGITVNAINVTGTITADQVQDKLRAPVTLWSGRQIFTIPADSIILSSNSAVLPFTRAYREDSYSTLFQYFLIEGYAGRSTTRNIGQIIITYMAITPLFNSSGRIRLSTPPEAQFRLPNRFINSQTGTSMGAYGEASVSGTLGLRVSIRSDWPKATGGGYSITLTRIAGVWKY